MAPIRTLVVDDDPDILKVLGLVLRSVAGWEVREAGSGREALELARDFQPDLMVVDVMMPDLDGPATVRLVRQQAHLATVPVVFLTAAAQAHELALLRSFAASHVLTKPFDPMALVGHLRSCLPPELM